MHSFLTVPRLADQIQVGKGPQDGGQSAANDTMIIHDHDANAGRVTHATTPLPKCMDAHRSGA
jgi:hypothetical protein